MIDPALHGRLARRELDLVRSVVGERPLPLWWWRLRRRAHGLLSPERGRPINSQDRAGLPADLEVVLARATVGGFALEGPSLRRLWRDLVARRPRTLVEFGAGTSTLALAHYCATLGPAGARVVSIEQGPEEVLRVRALLSAAGLAGVVTVVHAPLDGAGSYALAGLPELVGLRAKVDWILVDGPGGPPGCRGALAAFIAEHGAPGARWFLDDALREGELRFLREWARHGRLRLEGIVPVGQGIAQGVVR